MTIYDLLAETLKNIERKPIDGRTKAGRQAREQERRETVALLKRINKLHAALWDRR